MSFFTRLFGSQEENSNLTMRQIAEALGIEDPEISFDGKSIGTLKAGWKGASLHVRYGEGEILRCTLAHASIKHGFDLESDRERRKEPVIPLPDPSSKRSGGGGEDDGGGGDSSVHVGGGLFCKRADVRKFARLPAELRARMPEALIKARVCYFRAGSSNFDATFYADSESPLTKEHLIGALALAMEVCEARGLEQKSAPRLAPMPTAAVHETRSYAPLSVAKAFARQVPDATVEDLGGTGREGIWARVSFKHEGVAMRLVFYRFDAETCGVWLETRAVGKFGAFGVMKLDANEDAIDSAEHDDDVDDSDDDDDDDDDDSDDDNDNDNDNDDDDDSDDVDDGPSLRIFVGRNTYVDGQQAAAEAARVLSLPAGLQIDLHELVTEVGTVVLKEEVLSLNLDELAVFVGAREQHRGPLPYPVALGARLAALAAAIPAQSKERAELAEYRTCRFCATAYVFSPATPACVRCGAPPEFNDSV